MHGIQNLAGRSPHGVHQLGMDGIGVNPQNVQSALGVDGTTGVLHLQRSQRIIQSTLGGEAHGEEKVLQLIGSSMVGTRGVIMMRGRVVDGGDGAVLLLLQVLTAA